MESGPDYRLSPFTGWTRAHWEETADRMLLAVRPYASPEPALISLPGPASRSGEWSDGLEGFARTFLLAAFRLAGARGEDRLGIARWYAAGLAAGTDPASRWRWPRPDEIPQARVEAASVAIALHETRPWIWDRLGDDVQARVLDWMAGMVAARVPDNNWVWFRAVTEAFARSAGGAWSADDIDHAITRTDDWYAGGGWYTDGGQRNFDHYNGWAMHLYPLWYCRIAGEQELAARYRERLGRFLADAEHLIGGDGAPLFQGRSLTYRFAAAAPFWTGALFGCSPLAPGLTRRIGSGMLRYFLSRGCLRQDGTLSIGWHGEFGDIRQPYSGPGSPYWASKGFAGLLLPADDPVWTSVEEPLAVERGDFTRAITAPGWVVSGTSADGIVRVASHGTDHAQHGDDPFYSRCAYATVTGPDLSGGVDSAVTVLDGSGRGAGRGQLELVRVSGNMAVSRRTGLALTTVSAQRGCWEVRAVRVSPGADGCSPGADGCDIRFGSWAVAGDQPPVAEAGPGRAAARTPDGLLSLVVALHGAMHGGVHRPAGPHAFGQHAAVPYVQTDDPVAPGDIRAVAVALTASPGGPGVMPGAEVTDEGVLVIWADGSRDMLDWADG